MSAGARPRTQDLQALAAWVVVTWAVLDRFAAGSSSLLWAGVAFALGVVVRVPGDAAVSGSPRAWIRPVLGGAGLAVGVVGLRALLDLLAEGALPRGSSLRMLPWALLLVVALADLPALARLRRLFAVEWLKTRRGALFRSGLLAAFGVTLFAALTHERLPGASGWTLAADALGMGQWAVEVFLLVMGATAIAGEATGGTLKMMLPHAYRRSDWILAKAGVLVMAAVCFVLIIAVVSAGYAAVTEGLGDVTRELEPVFGQETGEVETFESAAVMRGHLVDTLLVTLGSLVTTALLGLFLSSLFDGVVASLCVGFLLFAGLRFADVLFNLPREALREIYAWYPDQLRNLTSKLGRALNERWDEALLPAGLQLALLTGAVALLLATRVFARRDLHG